ncbi:MAG: hypothetical protein KatS3mg081_2241 [Gemmatimonadales bacterium]|nr:MAG: hypothetical protein KatS3mg081_2241 [Gemmatimonadales bacterium]
MEPDATLGGYLKLHSRPPAFGGSDGKAYSVAMYVDEEPDQTGRFGGALLFVCWEANGERPVGHLETDYLVFGRTREEVEAKLGELTLYEVKRKLEEAIARRAEESF